MGAQLVSFVTFLLLTAVSASAQRLPTAVTPDHYDLTFVVDLKRERFDGTETIKVRVAEPTTRIVVNAVDLEIRDVTVGSGSAAQKAAVTLDEASQTATFTVPKPIPKGASDIRLRFSGILNHQLRGFYASEANGRKYAVTQFESTDARRAFPCFDEPAFKATFALTTTIDRGDTAIANGKVLSDVAGPAITQHTIKFATSPKMSSYLVAIGVGDFKCVEGSAEGVPIRICATPDKKDLGGIALDAAKQILTFYNSYYAIKYPFGKLDVVAVPDFAAGAMENTAAIFYRETDLLADSKSASVATRKSIASILAHEMAHQWFGDLVTMQWWDDLWLNEGFATWMANKPLAAAHPDWLVPVDEALENQKALEVDSLNSTRPIQVEANTPEEIEELFDAITYEKGASVLRMVERFVGAETFRKGVNAYLQERAYGNATSEDFSKALSAASGKPVERILPTFVNQPGFPLIDVAVSCSGGRATLTLKQQRFGLGSGESAAAANTRWQVPICLKTGGQATPTCDVLSDVTQSVVLPGSGCPQWVFANAGAQGYYRTAYAPEMLRAIAPHVATELTAPERLTLIDDEWSLVRAGRHNAADYLTLAAAYGREHASGVLGDVTNRLAFIGQYLTTAATRPTFDAFIRALLRPLFEEIGFEPGPSDSDERRMLRAIVIEALGTIGEDPAVIAKSRAALDRALAGGARLDPTAEGAVTRTAAAHGDAALFDALVAAIQRTTSPEAQIRYLTALSQFRDPALADTALQRALSPSVRSQDTSLYLRGFFQNPSARERAWTFVQEHWTELEPKIKIAGGDTLLVASLGEFCDARSRDSIVAFFGEHKLAGAVRTLEQTIERIDNCVGLQTKQTPAVAAWLATR